MKKYRVLNDKLFRLVEDIIETEGEIIFQKFKVHHITNSETKYKLLISFRQPFKKDGIYKGIHEFPDDDSALLWFALQYCP
jgi:hypothetical protein